MPTVLYDFFDLPVLRNVVPLLWFRTSARTMICNAQQDSIFPNNNLEPMDQYMAYECLTDIWWGVLMFRAARYVVHLGAALTIASVFLGGAAALASAS